MLFQKEALIIIVVLVLIFGGGLSFVVWLVEKFIKKKTFMQETNN